MFSPENMSTRNHILLMLKTTGPMSASEITDQMQITNMAVRRHLHALEKDGLIESETVRKQMGRPTAVYRITDEAEKMFPKKYHALMSDLLNELVQEAGPEMVERLFQRRKYTLQKKYTNRLQGKHLEEKVAALAGIQNENGYMAKWEKNMTEHHSDFPDAAVEYTLVEHNCPIAHIAKQYDHACQCEQELFASLLNADVKRTTCIAQGDAKCTYKIIGK